MKKLIICLILLFCTACGTAQPATEAASVPTEPTEPTTAALFIPTELLGSWVSARGGELEMVETITFFEDGSISVSAVYQGQDAGTIYGTYTVIGHAIHCAITQGTTPFSVVYDYRIDGRELTLTDEEGTAQYLRVA